MNRLNQAMNDKIFEEDEDFDLSEMQRKLRSVNYFGSVTFIFQDGEIVLIREERTLKRGSFHRFI